MTPGRRFSQNWLVVLIGFTALAVSFSSRGALSLSMPIWKTQFGWSRSFTSSIAAAALLMIAVVAPFAGNAIDRYGPRRLLSLGLLILGLGMLSVTLISSPSQTWLLAVSFSLIGGLGFGIIAQHVVATAIAMRFTENRGLATGIGTSGSTAGQVALLPFLAASMAGGSWRMGFAALGIASLALCPLVLLLVRPGTQPMASYRRRSRDGSIPQDTIVDRLGLMVRSRTFQLLFWSYLICGFTTSGVIETHFLPFASLCGFGPIPSATAYGVLSGVNLVGMIGAGWLSDRVNRPALLAGIYVARVLCFLLLMFVDLSYPRLILFAVLFGLFDYSTVPVTAALLVRSVGIRVLGLSMGLLSAGHAIGGALGAVAGGIVFDKSGRYDALWCTSIALALVAAIMALAVNDKALTGALT
ncbi:MFS transporter [Paraburkholderia fungorum]|uniref:MFS transporter n=1 Tax=Paraburkholderia fungorum TaxID=134537 RepID=UPI0038BBFB89